MTKLPAFVFTSLLPAVIVAAGCRAHVATTNSCSVSSADGSGFDVVVDDERVTVTQDVDGESSDLTTLGRDVARQGSVVTSAGNGESAILVLGPSTMVRVVVDAQEVTTTTPCGGTDIAAASAPVAAGSTVAVEAFAADGNRLFERTTPAHDDAGGVVAPIGSPPDS
jgi:hypothetical protein